MDNLPLALLGQFAELSKKSDGLGRVALGVDIREGKFLRGFGQSVAGLKSQGFECRILFLDASDRAVVQRFSETRHRHPLGRKILSAIREERRRLLDIKAMADKVIDTSAMTLGELKEILSQTLELKAPREMSVSVMSFGYKYGLPMDADLVMDVRFLPNPNYEPRLKNLTGLRAPVQRHILKDGSARSFLKGYEKLLASCLPKYVREGKSYLTLAVGCTGGRHRSVFVASALAQALRKRGYSVREFHRDIHK